MTKLYENVKMLCKEHGMTVKDLEVKLGIRQNTISSWGRSLPSCKKVIDVAHFFHVSVDYLLGEIQERTYIKKELHSTTYHLIEYAEAQLLSECEIDGVISIIEIMRSLSK